MCVCVCVCVYIYSVAINALKDKAIAPSIMSH